jgi:hypothetical protein
VRFQNHDGGVHFPLWIFFARTIDRFGKGLQTETPCFLMKQRHELRRKIFGFHRSMDTLGAVLGPSLALLYLYFYPENYTTLFYCVHSWTFAISATLLLKVQEKTPFFSFLGLNGRVLHVPKVVIGLLAHLI